MKAVSKYLSEFFPEVQGWCIPHLWQTIEPIHACQTELGMRAPIAEIGVYHGKFFIGLQKTKEVPKNYAFDVFDLQEFNLDGAGAGNRKRFLDNVVRSGGSEDAVVPIQIDSMTIDSSLIDQVRRDTGGFSLFSVDGCHMVEHTINDIRIAMQLTLPTGVIFVDDYYNAQWPGVQEGVAKLYMTDAPRFVPLLFSCNKLYLCHISYHDRLLKRVADHLRTHFPATRVKAVSRFGYQTLTVLPDLTSKAYLTDAP